MHEGYVEYEDCGRVGVVMGRGRKISEGVEADRSVFQWAISGAVIEI
jgi:hypothetical protein